MRILFGVGISIALAADLVTKWAAFRFLRPGERVPVIQGFFDLECAVNYGIVFGLKVPAVFTIIVSTIATAVVIWYLTTKRGKPAIVQIYLGFILAGVLGNLYDRLAIGAVRDFILLYIGDNKWPNFNIADAFILVGVGLAMVQFILAEDKKEEPAKLSSAEALKQTAKKADRQGG